MENNQVTKTTGGEKPKEYYTVSELADMVGVSRQRIHQLIKARRIIPDIVTPFVYVFKRATLEKIVEKFGKNI